MHLVEDSPYEDKCEFYEQLEKVLSPAVGKQIPIVLGIDANGVVGSVESESVGAVNASNESLNGMILRSDVSSVQIEIVKHVHGWSPDLGQQCRLWAEKRFHCCVMVSF